MTDPRQRLEAMRERARQHREASGPDSPDHPDDIVEQTAITEAMRDRQLQAQAWQADDPISYPMTDCAFCGIIAGNEPATVIREWDDSVAFVPVNPVTFGHVLVVPRLHVRDAVENETVTAQTMAKAIELAAEHPASNILTSVGAAATQSVFHLHIHVVPRFVGDQLMLPWGTIGDPHEPHRCKEMDRLEMELKRLREVARPLEWPWPFDRGAIGGTIS